MSSCFRSFAVRAVAICAFLLLLGLSVHAQSQTTGAISGAIVDPQNKPLAGAMVTVRNLATNESSKPTPTDSNGRFIISNLTPAAYEIEVAATNFSTYKQTNVIVEVGLVTPLDVQVNVAGQTQTLSVTAEAPVINTEKADFSTNINLNSVSNLPINGRRWSSYVLATPGTVADGTFGLISFRGISGLLNNNTIDGGDNNQAFFSEEKGRTRLSYSTSVESIQEFQVNTSNYSAEYGRAAGGVVNAVTKSGSNTIHGDLFLYDRSNGIGAAFNPFTRASVQTSPGVFTSVPIKPTDDRYQYGGDAGGYIFKDKLFWYFSFDGQNRNFPLTSIPTSPATFFGAITVAAPPPPPPGQNLCQLASGMPGPGGVPWNAQKLTPTPPTVTEGQQLFCVGISQAQTNAAQTFLSSLTGVVGRTGDQTIYFPKIDWHVNSNNTVSIEANRLRWNSPEGIQTGATVSFGIESIGSDFVKGDTINGSWTSIITPTITNLFRFTYGRDFEFESSDPPIPGEPIDSQGRSPGVSISGAASFTFGKPNFLERRAYPDEHHYQFSDSASFVSGKHFLKIGTDINYVNDILDNLFQEGGVYSYSSRVAFISDYLSFLNPATLNNGRLCGTGSASAPTPIPCYSSFNQGFGPTKFQFSTVDFGFFAQDDWHLNSRFTINAGLRWEYEALPKPQIPNVNLPLTGLFPNVLHDFGPRGGFAWDLTGHSKWVIRAGGGIYYGRIINSTISNAITNTGNPGSQLQLQTLPSATSALYPSLLSAGSPPTTGIDVVMFDGNARNPMIYEYDVVFEHEIARNTVVSASYLGSVGHDLPVFIDNNLPAPTMTSFSIVGGPLGGQTVSMPVFLGKRPNTTLGRFTTIKTDVVSHYNALALQFNRRMTSGLQFQMSYTLAQSTDSGQASQTFTASNNVVDPFDRSFDVGPSNFDIRHRFVGSAVWTPECFAKSESAAKRWLLSGWTVAPIVSATSGAPFSPSASGNFPSTGAPGGSPLPISTGVLASGGINRPTFVGRNSARLPYNAEVELRIARNFKFGERFRLQIFGEAFNLFNHTNYTAANSTIYSVGGTYTAPTLTFNSATFGALTNANNGSLGPTQRLLQLGGHFSF